jgi:hypothetical protein
VFIRQAHPGGQRHHYADYQEKLEGAREYKRLENLDWPVLVDDYQGTVHRQYSAEMADPSLLVDAEGNIAFYGMWTHIPTLKRAIDELLAQDGRGIVTGGIDRQPHLLASFVDGYRGLRRGGRRAVLEFDLGSGGGGTMSFLGNKAKPLVKEWALSAKPRSER